MATEIEKLKKEIAWLEEKKAEHERKLAAATQRRNELETRRPSLLAKIAEGNESARKEFRAMDGQQQELTEDLQAFEAGMADVTTKLIGAKRELARTEREAAIVQLETQIESLSRFDNNLERALGQVREATDVFIAAVTDVAKHLEEMDPVRFDSRYGYALCARIREVCWHRFEELAMPNQSRRPSFSERVGPDFRRAIAQLRYMGQEQFTPGRGERLYRALAHIPGLRDVDLLPGQLIPLRDEEAASFLKDGSIELVNEPAAQAVA